MSTRIHPLKRWLFENQETQHEFGARAGMAVGHLSEIINGKKQPSLRTIIKISKATKGKLMANDFQQFATAGEKR